MPRGRKPKEPENARPIDALAEGIIAGLTPMITEYNAKVAKEKSLKGDRLEVIDAIKADESDETNVKFKAAWDQLQEKLAQVEAKWAEYYNAEADKRIAERANETGIAELVTELDTLENTIRDGVRLIRNSYGSAGTEKLPEILTRKARASNAGAGTGVRRVRDMEITVDGTLATQKNNNGKDVSGFGPAAKVLKMETRELLEAYFKAAGTDKAEQFPDYLEFDVTVGDKTHKVAAKRLTPAQSPSNDEKK